MLKRVYIDNYKSLVNFELALTSINLFLGANGSGKSAVFEVLRRIQGFVGGMGRAIDLFSADNRTRWQTSPGQTFELEIEGNEGIYKYELSIEHFEEKKKARARYECLWFNDRPLLKLENGDVQLYRDDHSAGPIYSVDWSLSAVGAIPPRHDNTRLTWFKDWLDRLIIVHIVPVMMSEASPQEESLPSPHLENFTSWYRSTSYKINLGCGHDRPAPPT